MTFVTLLSKTRVKLPTVAVVPGVDVILYVTEFVLYTGFIHWSRVTVILYYTIYIYTYTILYCVYT